MHMTRQLVGMVFISAAFVVLMFGIFEVLRVGIHL